MQLLSVRKSVKQKKSCMFWVDDCVKGDGGDPGPSSIEFKLQAEQMAFFSCKSASLLAKNMRSLYC